MLLHDNLGNGVSRHGYHAVGNNRSVLGYADIRRARAHVHQRNVQQAELFRDRHVDRGDRLERQVIHLKSGFVYRGVQAVNYLLRQEGCKNLRRNPAALMPVQIQNHGIVQVIMHHCIADTIKIYTFIPGFPPDNLVGLLNRDHLQRMDRLRRDQLIRKIFLAELLIHPHRDRFENPACRRNAHARQFSVKLTLQLSSHLCNRLGYLLDIVDLPVHHRPRLVKANALRDNGKTVDIFFVADRPYDASRADIQAEYKRLLNFHAGIQTRSELFRRLPSLHTIPPKPAILPFAACFSTKRCICFSLP